MLGAGTLCFGAPTKPILGNGGSHDGLVGQTASFSWSVPPEAAKWGISGERKETVSCLWVAVPP